jgi:predicted MFS family arabinose efflux permease
MSSRTPLGRGVIALGLAMFAVGYGTNVSTPLLILYQADLGMSTWALTALFAIYPLGLAPSLVVAGPASDVIGRRRIVLPGVVLSAVGSLVMIFGQWSVGLLFFGRFMLGVVAGMVFVVASAWMRELNSDRPLWAARFTGIVLYIGFALGSLAAGAFGEWLPLPLTLAYVAHIVLVLIALAFVGAIPETVAAQPGRRIRPNLGIPASARSTFVRIVLPTGIAVFGFPSVAIGLYPVLLREPMGSVAVFVAGVVTALAFSTIVFAQALVGRWGPVRSAPIGAACGALGSIAGTIGFLTGAWPLLFPAAVLVGVASGMCMTAGLRMIDMITDPRDRGALTGTFYAVIYAAMTMPLWVSTAARAIGYTPVLITYTLGGVSLMTWLIRATKPSRPAMVALTH